MSISKSEFLRILPHALAGATFDATGDLFVHTEAERSWRITLKPLPPQDLGSVRLERHVVEWRFSGYTEQEIAMVLERFDVCFRRGGG